MLRDRALGDAAALREVANADLPRRANSLEQSAPCAIGQRFQCRIQFARRRHEKDLASTNALVNTNATYSKPA